MAKVEVLCVTMNQNDFKKINEMNISTNVVFANQANDTRYEEICYGDNIAKMITTNTKGVGTNRNLALMYATGEYLLFSDDDLKYIDGYSQVTQEAFAKIPKADCIIFNIETKGAVVNRRKNQKIKRIKWYNALNYGAVRIAVKKSAISRKNIMFNTNFGGGTPFSCGEDTLYIVDRSFISDMVYRKLDHKKGQITLYQIGKLCGDNSSRMKIIFCHNDKAFKNAIARGENNITVSSVHKLLDNEFASIENLIKCFTDLPIMDYNYEHQSVDDVINFIKGGE